MDYHVSFSCYIQLNDDDADDDDETMMMKRKFV